MSHFWLLSLPETPNLVASIQTHTTELRSSFSLPRPFPLNTGTLDSLVAISDDLTKLVPQVENLVRKIERQKADLSTSAVQFRIGSQDIETYISNFQWDSSKFQLNKSLPDLMSSMQGILARIDDDLKKNSTNYQEKITLLSTLQRKRQINYATSDLEDFMDVNVLKQCDSVEGGEFLRTVLLVVPKAIEREFRSTLPSIGLGLIPDKPDLPPVSPNPKSITVQNQNPDSLLFSVDVLKGFHEPSRVVDGLLVQGPYHDLLEPLRSAFREKRVVMRELTFDIAKIGQLDRSIRTLESDTEALKRQLISFCDSNFGEAYSCLLHLLMIHSFVESVLRYGLPARHHTILLTPAPRKEKLLLASLSTVLSELCPVISALNRRSSSDSDEKEEDEMDALPYVCMKVSVIGSSRK